MGEEIEESQLGPKPEKERMSKKRFFEIYKILKNDKSYTNKMSPEELSLYNKLLSQRADLLVDEIMEPDEELDELTREELEKWYDSKQGEKE